jgi:hypothetical protein
MHFADWTGRMATPPQLAQAILMLQAKADETTRAHFAIEADGSFALDAVLIEA